MNATEENGVATWDREWTVANNLEQEGAEGGKKENWYNSVLIRKHLIKNIQLLIYNRFINCNLKFSQLIFFLWIKASNEVAKLPQLPKYWKLQVCATVLDSLFNCY